MKSILHTILLLLLANFCFAQKPPVGFNECDNWAYVTRPAISNDGKYVMYNVGTSRYHLSDNGKMIVQQVGGSWKKELAGVINASFTADSRTIVANKGDTLCLLKLGGEPAGYITSVQSFKLFSLGKQEYLLARKLPATKELLLKNLNTGKEQTFTGVIDFMVGPGCGKLVIRIGGTKESGGQEQLCVYDLITQKQTEIAKGFGLTNYVFNRDESKLAFAALQLANKHLEHVFYSYTFGDPAAVKILDNHSAGIDTSMNISQITRFSKDGQRLFFTVEAKPAPPVAPKGVMVDVWSYLDPKPQSVQLIESGPNRFPPLDPEIPAVLNLETQKAIILAEPGDIKDAISEENCDDYLFRSRQEGDGLETKWNKTAVKEFFKTNTKTGERTTIDLKIAGFNVFSPDGRFVVGTKPGSNDIFSVEPATGKTVNMTGNLPVPKFDAGGDFPGPKPSEWVQCGAWLMNDAVLLYDKYDIWQLDLTGTKPAINLTGGYGRKAHIILRLTESPHSGVLKGTETILLSAFNPATKENGFYNMQLGKSHDPELLTMGPCLYHWDGVTFDAPVKAKDANVWVVTRQTASESPNLFVTSDFKTFVPLTDIHPEKNYNWLTSELMSWKDTDGTVMQGILYKPENFDPAKKYPVIFNYYDKMSDRLNEYLRPDLTMDNINIPWYVSHGYLVYTPDIHYKIGHTGESVLNSVVGAAKMLMAYPWVDAAHMGIQGHSFGGYETNYLVTHTNMFAAAMAAAGVSDLVSGYNYLWDLGGTNQDHEENGQGRIGATLWNGRDLYIENSAVLKAYKVTTPLLLMNNILDGAVPYTQGVEMFLSLRRLGKPVWMLQYDGEHHNIVGPMAMKDYTIRMNQFFDHYLKGAAAPTWMLKGIPAAKKGIDSGYELSTELDANGKPVTPGPGLLK